jgi:hypothetical protein
MNTFTAQDMKEYAAYSTKAFALNTEANFKNWCKERFEPTKKVIDLSVLIDGIDCEFSDCDFKQYTGVGRLSSILGGQTQPFVLSDAVGYNNAKYEQCRPRMNHKHAWQGGECPLPEGFMVKVWYRNGDSHELMAIHSSWYWVSGGSDIIHFQVLRVADGYVMPWGVSDE